ncbi:MAG: dihydrolipoamide acetyltransferase family protein [Micrococcales bacterium]|nr:dihydrolipoamide acetyltransferase family protein [Micrococcales bacterium]
MGIRMFNLPDPGEGLTEAEIVSWKVKPGDVVKVNDVVVEIETSKSLVELPIPWEGTVGELLASEGDEVLVGAPIVTIEVAGAGDPVPAADTPTTAAPAVPPSAPAGAVADVKPAREPNLVGYGAISGATTRRARKTAPAPSAPAPAPAAATSLPAVAPDPAARPLAKPPVRKYAKDRGVDLAAVSATGCEGTVTRDDIDGYLDDSAMGAAPAADPRAAVAGARAATPAGQRPGERETRIPIKGVRKMTAQAMVGSAFTAPHVTEFVTIDVSATMDLVERLKGDREFRDVKVTPLLVVAKALLLACRRNRGVNATWDQGAQEIVQKNYVNLGIAAATPRGLVVPNVKDADAMTMRELADAIAALVATARAGRTQPADMSGGSITITNVGVFGVDTGTPIINSGESAILAFGAIRRMPWVVTDAAGSESIVPRWVTTLGLSFDHRLVDGDLGSRFLADVAAILSDPTRGLVWG